MNAMTGIVTSFCTPLPNQAYRHHMNCIRQRPALCSRCSCQAFFPLSSNTLESASAGGTVSRPIRANTYAKNSPLAKVTPIDRVTGNSVKARSPSPTSEDRNENSTVRRVSDVGFPLWKIT